MSNKKSLIALTAFIFTGFLGVSTANAQNPNQQCYTLASLQGTYAITANYGSNLATSFAVRYFDGNGNLHSSYIINEPTPGSTTGARTITSGTQVGTYTVNCNGTGVITRVLTQANGSVSTGVDDFIVTAAVVQGGQLLATNITDAQRTPSAIVPGGIFLVRTYTRLPDFFY